MDGERGIAHVIGRTGLKRLFIDLYFHPGAPARPLAGDASARSYERIHGPEGRRAVLMDAPTGTGEDIRPFLALTGWLRAQGYSAPEPLAADPGQGLLLMEDLGDDLYARLCEARPEIEARIYAAAVDLLLDLHRRAAPACVDGHEIGAYGPRTLWREARLLTRWYMPAAAGAWADPEAVPDRRGENALRGLLAEALAPALAGTPVMVLRDYHALNLIWLPGREGLARVGLLDYQDALRGHPAYDLVSLLEDARRDTSAGLRAGMVRRYLDGAGTDAAGFAAAYAALGAQRNMKIIGIFARLWLRDGKEGYLRLIPRVWAHLARDLSHPSLGALRDWVARHVPPPTAAALAKIAASRPAPA